MKVRTITSKPAVARPSVVAATTSPGSRRRSHPTAMASAFHAASDAQSLEDDFKIVWPRGPIPIERTLNERNLILHFGKTAVVLTPSEARRLAYSLLLEAETTAARPHALDAWPKAMP